MPTLSKVHVTGRPGKKMVKTGGETPRTRDSLFVVARRATDRGRSRTGSRRWSSGVVG